MKKKFKVGGLFSGVGGIELGFQKNGFSIVWANEYDKHCQTTYLKNFEHKFIFDDIHKINGASLEPVDVLCGGFPCQAFSVAGYRKGLKDSRGNLFFEIVRLINELETKPKVLFLENVKNFYTHDGGRTFRILKQELEHLGYCVFTKVLNTSLYTSIPQTRERTFIICFLEGEHAFMYDSCPMSRTFKNNFPPKEIRKSLPMTEVLEKHVPEKYYYRSDKYMYKSLIENMKRKETFYQWRRVYVRENKSNLCPTLTANMGTGGHNVPLVLTNNGIRKLTPRECFTLQGFPKDFHLPEDIADSHLYKQAGNSVTVTLIESLAKIVLKSLNSENL